MTGYLKHMKVVRPNTQVTVGSIVYPPQFSSLSKIADHARDRTTRTGDLLISAASDYAKSKIPLLHTELKMDITTECSCLGLQTDG